MAVGLFYFFFDRDVDIAKKDTPNKDPLASLAKLMKGSKRNALLKWCQLKTIPYSVSYISLLSKRVFFLFMQFGEEVMA